MAGLSPMMQQYKEIKEKYKDCILFYRVGDFYEMFFEDALCASKALEITLTGKECGLEERAPMCGVPYHACDTYANRLIELGYKVGICEQVEDPKTTKGLVKRDVIRIITPGTNLSTQNLKEGQNNYLMSIYGNERGYGIAVADITTGETRTCELGAAEKVKDEINKYCPSEILCNEYIANQEFMDQQYLERLHIAHTVLEPWYYQEERLNLDITNHYQVASLDALGLKGLTYCIGATGALIHYLMDTQKNNMEHMQRLELYHVEDYMIIDSSTRRNLELTETLRDKEKRGSLLWVLDKTQTAMGARMLRTFIEQPLLQKNAILARYDAIDALNGNQMLRDLLREHLNPIYDLERLLTRISLNTANPRDLIAFKNSLAMLPRVKEILGQYEASLLMKLYEQLDCLEDLWSLLEASIEEDPPIQVKEGGIIKAGYLQEIDELKRASVNGKSWLASLEEKEREASGIKNLKIKYNKVFGYYFDVTNSYKALVPDYFIRKQTLANSERYTTLELDELAKKILGSEDKLYALEYETFNSIRKEIANQLYRVQQSARAIATVDVLASMAYVSAKNNYCRPTLNEEGRIKIECGRHCVVEQMIQNDAFIHNDTILDWMEHRMVIITGPNMAGKSTYMRQTALIVLMAQIGCFVPAESADIGIVDRIFTRVGASDDLASGQSTFMVEMSEVANILRNATKNSLIILDEIGRGTSTYDGLSIAWAVAEYICQENIIGAKTLFATHYHEMTQLEGILPGVKNYSIAVKENGEHIIFLRKIVQGGADRSYGIQVARLAGVPAPVISRANQILQDLLLEHGQQSNITLSKQAGNEEGRSNAFHSDSSVEELNALQERINQQKEQLAKEQEKLQASEAIIHELMDLDIGNLTPINALMYLSQLQERLK